MTPEISNKLFELGFRITVGGSIACVIFAIFGHPSFLAGAVLLWGMWIIYCNIREKKNRRLYLSAFQNAFKQFAAPTPALEIGSSYGRPSFKITFKTEGDLKKAQSEEHIGTFKNAIQELCAPHYSSLKNPFDAERAIYTTYEGRQYTYTRVDEEENQPT